MCMEWFTGKGKLKNWDSVQQERELFMAEDSGARNKDQSLRRRTLKT